jgi:hypothetical protein
MVQAAMPDPQHRAARGVNDDRTGRDVRCRLARDRSCWCRIRQRPGKWQQAFVLGRELG